jgi:hypothetical protein
MKTLNLIFAFMLTGAVLMAQTPQSIKYQAVARDNSGNVLANRNVSFKISILQGTVTGTAVYSELHAKTTNVFGLVDLEIGKGSSYVGDFTSINWGGNSYFVKVEMDPTGGIAFQYLGTSQLLSVPYALMAKKAEEINDNSVTTSKIANNAVTSAKIADNTITGSDLDDVTITPNKISPKGTLANQVLYSTGLLVAWGYTPGSEIKVSIINVNCSSIASFSSTYVKIADLGTVTKIDATSKLEITFNGRITANTITGTGAHFELRVDNNATTLGRARANIRTSEAGGSGIPVSITGIFTGFGVGSHTISIWVKGSTSGTTAMVDPGCWSDDYVIIREIK